LEIPEWRLPVKLATFRSGGRERIALVHSHDSRLFDLAAAADRDGNRNPAFTSMLSLIDAGPSALDQARALYDRYGKDEALSVNVSGAEILAPIPEPRQMRDGMSFPLHILQAPRGQRKLAARARNDMAELARIDAEPLGELPEVYGRQPIYYITNRFSVRGTNTTVKWPRYSQVMDYELEFGIIPKTRAPTSRPQRPGITSSASQSSTISPPVTPSASRWRGGWAPPRARALTAAT